MARRVVRYNGDSLSAKDIMTSTNLVTVSPEEKIVDAVKKMYENNVGSVLVVDEEGKLVGIFTERDLVKVVATGTSLETPIKEVMTKRLITVKPEDPLPLVASKMIENNIRHIPVVDKDGKLKGIISIRRVLRHVLASCSWP